MDEETPTQRIWAPVSELDIQHAEAFRQLQNAMTNWDMNSAAKAMADIAMIEIKQQIAHAAARNYARQKLRGQR